MAHETLTLTEDEDGNWDVDGDYFPLHFTLRPASYRSLAEQVPKRVVDVSERGKLVVTLAKRRAAYIVEEAAGIFDFTLAESGWT